MGWLVSSSILRVGGSDTEFASSPVILGIGMGILYAGTNFPVLSPLRPEQHPQAVCTFTLQLT